MKINLLLLCLSLSEMFNGKQAEEVVSKITKESTDTQFFKYFVLQAHEWHRLGKELSDEVLDLSRFELARKYQIAESRLTNPAEQVAYEKWKKDFLRNISGQQMRSQSPSIHPGD